VARFSYPIMVDPPRQYVIVRIDLVRRENQETLMFAPLFKYVNASTALTILENKTLQWSAPALFNDPFEFKSPFQYGFEWDELKEIVLQRWATILTQVEEPNLFPGNPVASVIPDRRLECKGRNPAEVSSLLRPRVESFVRTQREESVFYEDFWDDLKQTYRVLCLSGVHNHILMWSHYTNDHQGVALEFRPIIGSEILAAQPVSYSDEVPVAANLNDFVKYLTGVGPKPIREDAWKKAVLTKSSVWVYENEWRVISKRQIDEEGLRSFRRFEPEELVGIYFGCRISSESRERIIAAISNWKTPVSLFQMRDERIRFELTAEAVQVPPRE